MYLQVILNLPVNQPFTYSYTPPEDKEKEIEPAIGKRAEIMFGNKKTIGFIIGLSEEIPKDCPVDISKIRPIKRVLDKEPLFGQELIELARWVSHYYLCAFGEAVFSMIPSAKRESGAGAFIFEEEASETKKNELSDEQKTAVENITSNNKSFFHYLYGPTGSGKTEVFFQIAEKIMNQGKGVIYLVPEISLTGQVAKAAMQRFGDTAAILHSGLTASQRLNQWNRIMHKEARIIIGARSAIFAPVLELGLIIIDEEHDNSYKSGNNPRYHARQVAMHRCTNLKIPLVMGSATPSVEAWYGMNTGSIVTHKLTKRLAGGTMPHIQCIDLNYFENDSCISKPLEEEINKTLEKKQQAILFLNRRGFTHFFRCNSCGFELKCKNCSVPLTYHKNLNRLKCHYCGWSVIPPQSCPDCGSLDIGSSGFGTEYIEAEAHAKFPNARILRLDTDALKNKEELLQKLEEFREGKYDLLLGTQMVAKGLNFPKLVLVGVIMADAGLHMPDFRAAERTFALITQVAGRSGRYIPDGKVMVQTYSPRREPVYFACKGLINEFYASEINERKLMDFPPFSRLLRIVFRSHNKSLCLETAQSAYEILNKEAAKNVELLGPAECPIEKINNNFRFQIILKSNSIIPLQAAARKLLYEYTHNQYVYIEYDVDPVSLL